MPETRTWITASALGMLSAISVAASEPLQPGGPGQQRARAIQTPIVGSCDPDTSRYIATDSTDLQTSSLDYVGVPQASMNFQQQADGCVIVYFSGVVFAPGVRAVARRILLRAVLEGTALVATPSEINLSGDDDENFDGRWGRAHSMIFVFPAVRSGHYRVSVQWKSGDGTAVHLHQHTVLIRHQ